MMFRITISALGCLITMTLIKAVRSIPQDTDLFPIFAALAVGWAIGTVLAIVLPDDP